MYENYSVKQEFGPFPNTALSKNRVKRNRINQELSVFVYLGGQNNNCHIPSTTTAQYDQMFRMGQKIFFHLAVLGLQIT